jgi:hypothetical protein
MTSRFERASALVGILAVVLWVVGFVVAQVVSSPPSDSATDAQVLAWIKDNSDAITLGSWLFMLGSGCFVWFAGTLRGRLAAAEGGPAVASTIGFTAAVATGLFGMGLAGADMAASIDASNVSVGAAGALHQVGTVFFLIAELAAAVMLAGFAAAALRTRALPTWWAVVAMLLAVVLVIGPIGWLALLFGLPLWSLLTAALVLARTRRESAPLPAPAAA